MQSDQTLETQPLKTAPHPVQPEYEDDHDDSTNAIPPGIHLPPESIWPVTLAFGSTLGFMGLVTSGAVSIIGIVIAFLAIFNWVQELRHEHH